MRTWLGPIGVVALASMLATPVSAQPKSTTLALVDVTVIPMDRERVIEHQTIIVRDGMIAQLGPVGSIKPPAGAQTIDGKGKFVMPGLAEMHGHLQGDDAALNERILLLNAAYGVTTLRNMQGHPAHVALRDRVARGELLGPRIYTAGPSIGGNIKTAEAATSAVSAQKQAGFDLLKIQEGLSRAAFDATAERAHALSLPFAGHIPAEVGLARALEARYASIDHLDGYIEALVKPGAADLANAGFFGSAVLAHVDEARIPELVRQTKAAGVAVVPTETLIENFFSPEPIATLFARPELKYLPPAMLSGWEKQKRGFMTQGAGTLPAAEVTRLYDLRRALIRAMQRGGVLLTLGSDAPQVLNVPGLAIHRELELMVKAGLTPYEALVTGTRNIAVYFGTQDRAGTIAQGKQADLLLLDANPLRDITNTQKRAGVVVAGRWLSAADAAARLSAQPGAQPAAAQP